MAARNVVVQLGGAERVLRCDLGAWAAIEDHGYQLQDLLAQLNRDGKVSFKALRILLWGMLGNGTTLEDVGHWVTGENFAAVLERVGEALRDAFPEEAASAGNPPRGSGPPASASPISAG